MQLLIFLALLIGFVVAAALLLRLLCPLPSVAGRTVSTAITDTDDCRLGVQARERLSGHPGLNGVHSLSDGRDALAARVALARAAERSLDVQYYIWHGDISGNLLAQELIDAADRGVRVRLLLDDNGTAGLDRQMAALDAHDNIEVRLFNPFVIRKPKTLNYLMDFGRLNRRMHNKSFIADSQAVVVGGRNVGDEYFGAPTDSHFEDLDLFAIGPVVADVSADFDRYWASASSHHVTSILPPPAPAALDELRRQVDAAADQPLASDYARAIERSHVAKGAAEIELPMIWAPVRLVSDDPAKGLDRARRSELLAVRLAKLLGDPGSAFSLISAYFVPTRAGRDWLVELARRGVSVTIMTNAFEATDVAAVHAGYGHHRKAMLQAGIRLWELKAEPGAPRRKIGIGSGSGSRPVLPSSGASLHTKAFAVDGARIFIGSFNFDPRSVALNTELGFLVDSKQMATEFDELLDTGVASRAYEVRLGTDGRLQWLEETPDGPVVHRTEPGTRFYQRAIVMLLSWLPIDWML